eukprot:2672543-Rhodomonas_salina.4
MQFRFVAQIFEIEPDSRGTARRGVLSAPSLRRRPFMLSLRSKVLGDFKRLAHLNLSGNRLGIGAEGTRALAGVLGECKALAQAHLDLSENQVGDESAEKLAGVIGAGRVRGIGSSLLE